MIIQSLELKDYRNYDHVNIIFSQGTNIFYGDNAQGKTNILEAIYLCATTKSHRGNKDKEIIKFQKKEAHIRTGIIKHELSYQVDIHLKNNKSKGIAINKIPIKKASDLFGILNVVSFSPEDLNIIKEAPANRRRFLDGEICQLDKLYLSNLTKYNKILLQRSKLLKEIYVKPGLMETLSVWDMQLASYGEKIIQVRQKFIEELNEIVVEIHKKISGNKEELKIVYKPNTEASCFLEELERTRDKDLKYHQTSVGPHRDDMMFFINGMDVKKYGSQGQQKTAALSLKLGEIEFVKRNIKDTPILLLDDVLSELDSNRQNYLLNSIKEIQTIITCTGLDEFVKNRFQIDKLFKVVNGVVSED